MVSPGAAASTAGWIVENWPVPSRRTVKVAAWAAPAADTNRTATNASRRILYSFRARLRQQVTPDYFTITARVRKSTPGPTARKRFSTSTPVEGAVVLGPRLAVLGAGEGQARLQLTVAQAGDAQVRIYNARGMLVRDLFSGRLDAGQRVLVWDGRDTSGRTAASGVYFVRAITGGQSLTGRVVMVR